MAALLAYTHATPGMVDIRPPLVDLLAKLDRDQLAGLLLRLATQDAELVSRIDMLLATEAAKPVPVPAATSAGSGPVHRQHTAVDERSFQQQIRRVFRAERSNDYMAYSGILANLEPLVGQIQAFLNSDDAQNALVLLKVLTEEYSQHWFEYDDSDGEPGIFFDELGMLWTEALLGANLKKAELKQWHKDIKGWASSAEEYGCEGLGIALQAASEGWSEPWIEAAIIGEAQPNRQPTGTYTNELLAIRLRILERSGHTNEALNLAKAGGMAKDQALILLRLGRINEVIALGRGQISSTEDALTLAQALRERGEPARALEIGEHGLGLGWDKPSTAEQEQAHARLAAWLVDLAASQGRIDLALYAGAEALRIAPELELYRHLSELAGSAWPELRKQLLADLRASKNWMVTGRIDITGRQPEWQAFLQGLRAQHGRKYKLMGLLDQLERARR